MALTKIPSNLITADAIDGTLIADDAINSEHIADGAIDAAHMSANSIDSDSYVDGSIDTAHIGDDQVTADKLANSINTSIAAKLPLAGGTLTGALVGTSSTMTGGFLGGSNGGIRIHSGGTKFFNITAANAARDNHMDIGASDARFKDLHISGSIVNSGDITIDSGANINLDADGGAVGLNDGGTHFASFENSSNSLYIETKISDKDILFRGNDGGSTITALTLDMSEAGAAVFNSYIQASGNISTAGAGRLRAGASNEMQLYFTGSHGILSSSTGNFTVDAAGDIILDADGGDITLKDGGTEFAHISNSSSDVLIQTAVADKDIKFAGTDGSTGITALTLDMSDAGAATFNNHITASGNIYTSGNVNLTADNKKIRIGAGEDLQLYHDGSNSHIYNDYGVLYIDQHTNDGNLVLRCDDMSGGLHDYFYLDGGSGSIKGKAIRDIEWTTTATNSTAGHHIFKSYNTEIMRIDGANNRVGIGTDSPSVPLQVHGGFKIHESAGDELRAYFNPGASATADPEFTIYRHDGQSASVRFRPGTDNYFENKIGIGTTSPNEPLTIRSSAENVNTVLLNIGNDLHATNTKDAWIRFEGGAAMSDQSWAIGQSNDSFRFVDLGARATAPHSGTEKMRILASGGITFNGDSAAANALDDYEEGTWTPALGNITVNTQSVYGIYTKIGNLCYIHAKITATVSSLPGATWKITGLPYTATNSSDTGQRSHIAIGGDSNNLGSYANGRAFFRTDGAELQGITMLSGTTAYWTYNAMAHTTFEIHISGSYLI